MNPYTVTYQSIAESLSKTTHTTTVNAASELSAQMYFHAHYPNLIVVSVKKQEEEKVNN